MKVRISVPVHHEIHPSCAMALASLSHALPEAGISIDFDMPVGESLVTRARNAATKRFLASDATHQLWVDADVVFNPADIVRLCKSGHPFAGIPYPKKRLNWPAIGHAARNGVKDEDLAAYAGEYVLNMDRGDVEAVNGFVPCRELGTGMLLVAREVYEKIAAMGTVGTYTHEDEDTPTVEYFPTPIVDGRLLSEDYALCRLARLAGYEVRAMIDAPLSHIGVFEFRGDLSTMLVPKADQ